ncbi:MAG: universal stress protein [Leifsonia sp.]
MSDEHPGLRVNTHIMAGDRLEELRRFSRPDNLVVVGTGQRSGPRARYHWSLGARLAATARGAVAVVPALPEEGRTSVVVGVDGSEVSLKAARFAAREARRLGHELVVVHSWLDPLVSVSGAVSEGPLLGELEEEHKAMLELPARIGEPRDDSAHRGADRRRHPRLPGVNRVAGSDAPVVELVGGHGDGLGRGRAGGSGLRVGVRLVAPLDEDRQPRADQRIHRAVTCAHHDEFASVPHRLEEPAPDLFDVAVPHDEPSPRDGDDVP